MIGRILSGRYVVEAKVGSGGMAIVYRGYDKIKKQTVAIKVLRPEYEQDEEFVRRFSREAEAASKVSHDNIVNMYDVGTDGDLRFIVMEFIDGRTLKEMIRDKGRIEPNRAIPMAIRILAAVDHAHRNGIVHRDIKPQNILVDKHGRVKVADFGIARLKTAQTTQLQTENAAALGSVHYFSPEQARGEVADEKSDLYSVGVVLYEMLTGNVPFDGDTPVAIAIKHMTEPPKSLRQSVNGVSKALDEVVMRALCKDPARRYQTAAEMAADLRLAVKTPRGGFVKYPQEGGAEPQEPEKERAGRVRRRDRRFVKRIVAVVGSLIVLSLIVLAGWYLLGVQGKIVVPELVGKRREEAVRLLEENDLIATVEVGYNEEYEAGLVYEQSVAQGVRVDGGALVGLKVSAGSQWYYLDSFVGQTEQQVQEYMQQNGGSAEFEYILADDQPTGQVLAQSLEPGYQNKEQPVVFTVVGRVISMPDLTGLQLEGALALIHSEGLSEGAVIEEDTPDTAPGVVIDQNIPSGVGVLVGAEVELTVSSQGAAVYAPRVPFTVVAPLENLWV
ncbi:MAG: protein kinase, partial [Clostridia bacterium]|nr:protein kinase [Clostridia bacterium]